MFVYYIFKRLIMLVLKLLGFQIIFLFRFITFPISIFNFCFISVNKILVRAAISFYSWLFSFISSSSLNSYLIKAATRFRRSIYVFLVLLVLLISCFAISGVVIAISTEAPFSMTQNLNFDYTKTSPSAIVPIITPSRFTGLASRNTTSPSYGFGKRAFSHNNRMRLTVSLTLPESEYNRKLGIFQVRVERLSANGDVIAGSSNPTMLRFKSEAIRVIESWIKMVPLMNGLESEVQNVRVVVEESGEEGGYEEAKTTGFKVSLEKRAEVEDGYGVPQIYGGSLEIASTLPLLKRMVWSWKLTIFVWIGFISFLAELIIILLFCRSSIVLWGR